MISDLSTSLLFRSPSDKTNDGASGTVKMSDSNPLTRTIMDNGQEDESILEEDVDDGSETKFNTLNYVNVISYLLNVLFTYGIGTLGWIGHGNNAILSEEYQTLITPNATAFSIWGVIFVAQGIFTIVQCLPNFRSSELVQKGIGYLYGWTCMFQIFWTIAFAYEVIWLSFIFMALIWTCLLGIVYRQHFIVIKQHQFDTLLRKKEFWMLRFPFEIHCGWITAASFLNLNVLFVSYDAAVYVQLAVGIVSLAVLHAISVWVLLGIRSKPKYTIAAVLAWASFWIYMELQDPKDSIVERFGDKDGIIVPGVSLAAFIVACTIIVQIMFRMFFDLLGIGMVYSDVVQDSEELVSDSETENYDPPHYSGKFVQHGPGVNSSVSTDAMDASNI